MLSSEFLEHIWQNCIEMSSEKQKQQAAMNRHQGRFEVPGSNPKIDISEKVLKNIMNTVQEIGGSSRRVNIVSSGSLGKLHCVCLYVCLFICGSLWIIFLKKMCEMAPRLSPRAKESLGGSIWGSSQRGHRRKKEEENLEPFQQRREIKSTEGRKSWIETAAAASVVTMVQANGANAVEENLNYIWKRW